MYFHTKNIAGQQMLKISDLDFIGQNWNRKVLKMAIKTVKNFFRQYNFHIQSVTLTATEMKSNQDFALGVLLTSYWDFRWYQSVSIF